MKNRLLILCILVITTSWAYSNGTSGITEPYPPISGVYTGNPIAHSPDPLVNYRWSAPKYTDDLEVYTLSPVQLTSSNEASIVRGVDVSSFKVTGACQLMFDFGQVNAGWLEFDSHNLDGEIEMSISEFNEPAVFNAGSEHPVKTAKPVKYGNTYRLELNKDLYEGVRFAWINIKKLNKEADISSVRLVCQVKPTNYEGSFACSDTLFTRIWYTGAYTVKLNLLKDYFGAILMERSDRHSWTGDAHTSQAASMVAFGNYDFVKANIRYTSTQFNGIASYSLYWVLSLIDYYNYTGDKKLVDELVENACAKLDIAYNHYGTNPTLNFYGWDERLGAGFENASCQESQAAYKMLSIRTWNEFGKMMQQAEYPKLADKYKQYANEKTQELRDNSNWTASLGVHAAADAVNAGFINKREQAQLWDTAFTDRQQRVSYSPFNQYFIITSLAKMQRHAEALSTIDDCWGGQLRYGGTTFFEVFRPSWNTISQPNDAPINNQCGYTSLTHPWSAGVTKWLTEEMLGIKPTEPGFTSFSILPHLPSHITSVEGSVPTPYGTIAASFDILKGICDITIPQGTRATLGIPKAGRSIKSIEFDNSKTAERVDEDDNFVYYQLAQGKYKAKIDYSGKEIQASKEPFVYANQQKVKEDIATQGNWKNNYGSKGYVLCNYDSVGKNIIKLPDFVEEVIFEKGFDSNWTTSSTDPRAIVSSKAGSKHRAIGSRATRDPIPCQQTMTIDIPCINKQNYQLSLYMADWDNNERRSAIEIFDLENKKLLMPVYMVRNYEEGKYITYNFDRPVRIRINQVRGTNAVVSGIFFD